MKISSHLEDQLEVEEVWIDKKEESSFDQFFSAENVTLS
jgi:hypothetical protein